MLTKYLIKKLYWLNEEKETEEAARQESSGKKEKGIVGEILGSTVTRQIGRTVAREVTRGLLGILGNWRNKKKKRSFLIIQNQFL